MKSESAHLGVVVDGLLMDLKAARARLLDFRRQGRGGEIALTAFALSAEVERLCRAATMCNDRAESEALLAKSRDCLDELQKLLGVH